MYLTSFWLLSLFILDVWVLGDSIPYWAGERAKETNKPNLKLPDATVAWWGVRGLRWCDFRRAVESQVLLSEPPRIILVHLGGNDLTTLSLLQLKKAMESEIAYLRAAFPQTMIIWCDILPRKVWRGAANLKAINEKRKRVNRVGRQIVRQSGRGDEILCSEIDLKTNFFREDGVHLNDVGLEFYLDYLREGVLKHL